MDSPYKLINYHQLARPEIRASLNPRLWSDTAHVRRLLRHCGVWAGAREVPFRSWDALPQLALVVIKWHLEHGAPFWHWVVFVRDADAAYVLDPKCGLRSNRRSDFGRIKPKWYIPVRRA